eukprot:g3524.t1
MPKRKAGVKLEAHLGGEDQGKGGASYRSSTSDAAITKAENGEGGEGGAAAAAGLTLKLKLTAKTAAGQDNSSSSSSSAAAVREAQEELYLQSRDFRGMRLRPKHARRPLWVCPDGRIFMEASSEHYARAYDFVVAIAEPVSRPECIHEYMITVQSLYGASACQLESESILNVLDKLSKNELPPRVRHFIETNTSRYGKVKLVLKDNRFFLESQHPEILRELLNGRTEANQMIRDARKSAAPAAGGAGGGGASSSSSSSSSSSGSGSGSGSSSSNGAAAAGARTNGGGDGDLSFRAAGATEEEAAENLQYKSLVDLVDRDDDDDDAAAAGMAGGAGGGGSNGGGGSKTAAAAAAPKRVASFEVRKSHIENVRKATRDLDYPILEEYDFRRDRVNPTLPVDLKQTTKIRDYQSKCLSKMFGSGRARSGIIVLPCGAGKTLVGITAATTIKKSCLVLCTSGVSVEQWRNQFLMWTNLDPSRVKRFTSSYKEHLPSPDQAVVLVSSYTMISFGGSRNTEAERIMRQIREREWGLLLLDEVHVAPAAMFRKVLSICSSHTKLGLTATLVREDGLIEDLNFLVGPKLYEANWMDLTRRGFLAKVQCAEVWCPMTAAFYASYCGDRADEKLRRNLYVLNPNKVLMCQFLCDYHEKRGDKILVFSDNVYALKQYAHLMGRPMIYGASDQRERMTILEKFRTDPTWNVILISKVGDTSIDLPEANVIIQVSSHFAARRQEAQRLGRILRPGRQQTLGFGGGADQFNAFFYTLVSTDTREMFYSNKRQRYLVDQGYTFITINHMEKQQEWVRDRSGDELPLKGVSNQLDLLAKVTEANSTEAAIEDDAIEDKDDINRTVVAARRAAGNMSRLSGAAAGYQYLEYSAGSGGGRGRGRGRGQGGGGGGGGSGGGAGGGGGGKDYARRLLNSRKKR